MLVARIAKQDAYTRACGVNALATCSFARGTVAQTDKRPQSPLAAATASVLNYFLSGPLYSESGACPSGYACVPGYRELRPMSVPRASDGQSFAASACVVVTWFVELPQLSWLTVLTES